MTHDGPRDGETFDPARDTERLNRQAREVWHVMSDAQWHTLADVAERTGWPEASISARLRDFRKPRFGGYTIDREYVGDGLHRYRWDGQMTNRQKGDYLERQTRAALRAHSWIVVRAAGSLGPADLVALRRRFTPLLISCKLDGRISPEERRAIREAAEAADARPLLACRTKRGWVDLHVVQDDGLSELIDQIKVPPRASSDSDDDDAAS